MGNCQVQYRTSSDNLSFMLSGTTMAVPPELPRANSGRTNCQTDWATALFSKSSLSVTVREEERRGSAALQVGRSAEQHGGSLSFAPLFCKSRGCVASGQVRAWARGPCYAGTAINVPKTPSPLFSCPWLPQNRERQREQQSQCNVEPRSSFPVRLFVLCGILDLIISFHPPL